MRQNSPRPARPVASVRNGLGLLECLLVCALLAALMMAMPSFGTLFDRTRVNLACSEFHQSILVARSEAIRRHRRVDMVPMILDEWRSGWMVLVDENNNQQLDSGELLIRRSEGDLRNMTIQARLRDTHKSYLAFGPGGRPRSASSASVPQIGSLTFVSGGERCKLVMNFLGRVRVCDPDQDTSAC